ncbi:MAG: hypothetical protein ACKPJO_22235 [Dolichospermum sp.]
MRLPKRFTTAGSPKSERIEPIAPISPNSGDSFATPAAAPEAVAAAAAAVASVAAIFGKTFDITSPVATGTAKLADSLIRASRSLFIKT